MKQPRGIAWDAFPKLGSPLEFCFQHQNVPASFLTQGHCQAWGLSLPRPWGVAACGQLLFVCSPDTGGGTVPMTKGLPYPVHPTAGFLTPSQSPVTQVKWSETLPSLARGEVTSASARGLDNPPFRADSAVCSPLPSPVENAWGGRVLPRNG